MTAAPPEAVWEWFVDPEKQTRSRAEVGAAPEGTRISTSVRIRYRKLGLWLRILPVLPFYSRAVKGSLVQLKGLIEGGT